MLDKDNFIWIRKQTKVDGIKGSIRIQTWQWCGHIRRREANRWTRRRTDCKWKTEQTRVDSIIGQLESTYGNGQGLVAEDNTQTICDRPGSNLH